MEDFKELTLSDFYNMDIFTRPDGSKSPLIDKVKDANGVEKTIGVAGYKATAGLTDIEIKEEAFEHYKRLMRKLNRPD